MKVSICLFYLAACTVMAADSPLTLHPLAKPLPFDHQGPFITTADNNVLCLDSMNALRSADEGKTWTVTPLFDGSSKYKVSSERALLRTRKGVIIAGWMNMAERAAPKNWNWGAKDAKWTDFVLPTYVCRSLDDGRTWETPIKLSEPWCGCIHSIIEMHSGRIVLVGQEIIPEWRHATVIFVSDDQGKTWQRSNMLDYGVGRHDHAGSLEGTVVERRDGTLYLLLRTESGYLWEATSSDGLKWVGLQQTRIRSVTCCPQMTRLADGRIALLWNYPPRHAPENRSSREELSIAFSDDEARSWSEPVVIAAHYGKRQRVSYPYLYEHKPGELWITTMQGGLRMKINTADIAKAQIPVYKIPPKPVPKPGGIVMFGDSTTAPRDNISKVYPERVQEALHSLGLSITVINAGISSNTTRDAKKRLARDVLDLKPSIVVMQFGINDSAIDVWKTPPASQPRIPLSDFKENLRDMIRQCRERKAIVILMTTNPLRWTPKLKDLYGKPPYRVDIVDGFDSPSLALYNNAILQVSQELKANLVNIHAAYPEFAEEHKTDIDGLLLDGMHPNDLGHQLVTEQLMPLIERFVRDNEKRKK
ncbi:MAG: exo-alpha-sialidase [Kiritimatiellae bacterium]|nr:exo-alpha-sialidase [Kiritimatiellia bacterium]